MGPRRGPDPEQIDRTAPGREVTENQEHGPWVFEEAQLDALILRFGTGRGHAATPTSSSSYAEE
jgi:hypothetical protein